MGASTVPTTGSGRPCTRAWYVLSTVRLRKASLRREYAYSLFATTMSPEVPTSSRLTTPWRSGAPEVEMRYPAAASPDTTSGPLQPTLGCAATPTGLSTTTMSSSSWTIDIPGTGWAMTCRLGLSSARGNETSSIVPAESRSDFATVLPSMTTWPSAARSAALVRETPKRRATPASTRSPSRPSGTSTVRTSGMVAPLTPRVVRLGSVRRPVGLLRHVGLAVRGRLAGGPGSGPGSGLVGRGVGSGGGPAVVAPAVDADPEQSQDDDETRCGDDPDVG